MNNPYNLYKVGLDNEDLIMKIMMYFSPSFRDKNGEIMSSGKKTVNDFLERNNIIEEDKINGFDVVKICEILFDKNMLIKTKSDGSMGLFNGYICNLRGLEDTPMWTNLLNSVVYGFEYMNEKSMMFLEVSSEIGNGKTYRSIRKNSLVTWLFD